MNKQRASGRKDGYACISGLADICERPHMSTEQRKAAKAAAAGRGTNVWSIAGAPERGAMRSLFIHVCGLLGDNKPLRGLRKLARAEQRAVYSYMFAGACP